MDINKVKSEIKGPASLIMLPFDDNLNLDLEGLITQSFEEFQQLCRYFQDIVGA